MTIFGSANISCSVRWGLFHSFGIRHYLTPHGAIVKIQSSFLLYSEEKQI